MNLSTTTRINRYLRLCNWWALNSRRRIALRVCWLIKRDTLTRPLVPRRG